VVLFIIAPITLFFALAVGGLLVHHAATHNGTFANLPDFINAYQGLFSTHEGVIVFLSIVLLGIILGGIVS